MGIDRMRSGVGGGEIGDRQEEQWGGRESVVTDSWSGVGRGEG